MLNAIFFGVRGDAHSDYFKASFAKVPKEEGVKIFVVVDGDNCKTPTETFCPGDRKVLADRLATNHILLQTISADENYISTS